MKLYPLTVIEFQDAFPTDRACFEYLCLVKWPDGFVCPHCGGKEAWKQKRYLLRCKNCHKDISVTAGTVFQDLRKPLRLIFAAMWEIISQKNGVSALSLQQNLGLGSYQTAWLWLHKLRRAMVRPGRDKLSGTVEVDETLVGGRRAGKRGRGAQHKVLVLIAVEWMDNHMGRVRLKQIENASEKVLGKAVDELVESGSVVSTDGWAGYSKLKENGFDHITTSHSEVEPGDDPTPRVHLVASHLKRWLLGTHQGAPQTSYLPYYLDEFTFRFNRRTSTSRGKLFYRLIQQALLVDPSPLATIQS
ncbi:IS1595 family transposase [bacterium]|nr:IS1595 family transposase [bacterium]